MDVLIKFLLGMEVHGMDVQVLANILIAKQVIGAVTQLQITLNAKILIQVVSLIEVIVLSYLIVS